MSTTSLNLTTILLISILLISHPLTTKAAISCGSVATALRPCIPYLQKGGRVPPTCCNGVKTLVSSASTTKDRRTACTCLKSAAGSIKGINLTNAAGLPKACGVKIPYAISPSTNCANVK